MSHTTDHMIDRYNQQPYTLLEYLRALHLLCEHWHSGQWSKGYRLLCLTQRYHQQWYGKPIGSPHLTDREATLYELLSKRYCNTL